jgi:putative phosphoesterase
MKDVLNREKNVDLIIHLGDGEADTAAFAHDFPFIELICVRGNGDAGHTPTEMILAKGDKTFFITHGHMYGVDNNNLESLTNRAVELKADIVLFGHSHKRLEAYNGEHKIYFMNPGSVSTPRDDKPPAYGVVELLPAGIVTSVKKVPTWPFK